MQTIQELIDQIKQSAIGLGALDKGILLDTKLAELDLLIYRLRSLAIPPLPKGVTALSISKPEDIHETLKDLFGE